jgi:threonine aldolase
VLGSIQPQAIVNRPDDTLDLKDVEAAIKPDDPHFAKTRLLALENTITGRVIPRAYFDEALALAKRRGLATHLDGARIFNAAVKLGMPVKELVRGFDSVSSCLSKGLGAPAGTMLLGSKDFIARAKRARKILGGVMRQAGVLAAAGLYALENNVERLAEDHANAERLAKGIGAPAPSSNMVFFDSKPGLPEHLAKHGVIVLPGPRLRLVTHLDIDAAGIDRAIQAFNSLK